MSLRKNLARAGVTAAMVAAPLGGAVVNAAPAHASAPACTTVLHTYRGVSLLVGGSNATWQCAPNLLWATHVRVIQANVRNVLNANHIPCHIAVDGSYGAGTKNAVAAFQRMINTHAHKHVLAVDGIAGPATNLYLNAWAMS